MLSQKVSALERAKNEYPQLFDVLAEDTTIVLVSIGVVILIFVVFTIARLYVAYVNAGNAKLRAEMEAKSLMEANLKFKEELQAHRLDKQQIKVIKENASDLESNVPSHFKLNWKDLKL